MNSLVAKPFIEILNILKNECEYIHYYIIKTFSNLKTNTNNEQKTRKRDYEFIL